MLIGIILTILAGVAVFFITGKSKAAVDSTLERVAQSQGLNLLIYKHLPTIPVNFTSRSSGKRMYDNIIMPYGHIIQKYTEKHNLSFAKVVALILQESGGKPTIENATRTSVGLMQLELGAVIDYEREVGGKFTIEIAKNRFTLDKPKIKDAATNIMIGTWYLKKMELLSKQFNIAEAISKLDFITGVNSITNMYVYNSDGYHGTRAYNAGQGNVFGKLVSAKLSNTWQDGLKAGLTYANTIYKHTWALSKWWKDFYDTTGGGTLLSELKLGGF